MAKQFFTERDIEDLAARGVFTLTVSDDVILTDLAYEKAGRLGVKLDQPHELPPASPVRPYLSEQVAPKPSGECFKAAPPQQDNESLRERIRTAVKSKFGDEIDPNLLETIITRVLDNIGGQ